MSGIFAKKKAQNNQSRRKRGKLHKNQMNSFERKNEEVLDNRNDNVRLISSQGSTNRINPNEEVDDINVQKGADLSSERK